MNSLLRIFVPRMPRSLRRTRWSIERATPRDTFDDIFTIAILIGVIFGVLFWILNYVGLFEQFPWIKAIFHVFFGTIGFLFAIELFLEFWNNIDIEAHGEYPEYIFSISEVGWHRSWDRSKDDKRRWQRKGNTRLVHIHYSEGTSVAYLVPEDFSNQKIEQCAYAWWRARYGDKKPDYKLEFIHDSQTYVV